MPTLARIFRRTAECLHHWLDQWQKRIAAEMQDPPPSWWVGSPDDRMEYARVRAQYHR